MMLPIVALAVADAIALLVPGLGSGARLAAHVVLTLAGFAVVVRRGPIGIGTGMLGLLGPIGLLAADQITRHRRPRRAIGTDVPTAAITADPVSTGARMLDGRLYHATPGKLGSLVTVLRHGTVTARRRSVETVVRSFEPALSPLIARALADRDQTIRALAAAAAARVSRNLAQGRVALARRAERGDAQAGDALLAMLADHARANVLLSDAQREHLRRDVLALLRDRSDGPAQAIVLAEAAWSVGDYSLIDDLAKTGQGEALDWWRSACRA